MVQKKSCCGEPEAVIEPVVVASAASCCSSETPACSDNKKIDYLFWGSLIAVALLWCAALLFSDEISDISWLNMMAHTVHHMLSAMWWGVVIGIIFIGILSKIPREYILSLLGSGGTVSGLLRATGAGVLLDLCSHGILMVASKLYERGASAGQVIAFLLASPWNSFSLTLVLIGLIGLQWTLMFIVLSMVIAWVTGWVFDQCVKRGILAANPNAIDLPDDFDFWQGAKTGIKATQFNWQYIKEVVLTGFKDSKMVLRWLLFGILLAAILRALLDPSQFEAYFGATMFGLLMTIILATVLEVCSEGATPIAADIVTRAQAPGNGFAFLMAGVATDYTEIMVLKDMAKSWKFALFLPLITVPQVILVALLINGLS